MHLLYLFRPNKIKNNNDVIKVKNTKIDNFWQSHLLWFLLPDDVGADILRICQLQKGYICLFF